MARTDALAVEGLQSAIDRACACVEAGADMIFPEAMTELDQYREFVQAVGVPVLANITEFGATPLFTTQELGAVGVKKSVALSGTAAGNTALCTVGRTGNDLHYRGYDILDSPTPASSRKSPPAGARQAAQCAELRLQGQAEAPARPAGGLKAALEQLPPSAHPMDVMRTGVSVLGCCCRRRTTTTARRARHRRPLMASLGSMLLYWYHFSHNGKRIDVETDDDSIGGHFLHLLHGEEARELGARHAHLAEPVRRARVQRLHLHLARDRRHRFDMYSAITGGIGALRGPKHGGANEVAFEIQKRYDNPDEAEADIRARVESARKS
jgi:2-methylcitrate synthase